MVDETGDERSEGNLDSRIAEIALRKIDEAAPGAGGVLLSVLGNRISDELGPLRQYLGSRTTLRRVLEAELGGKVAFMGLGNRVSVRLNEERGADGSPVRTGTRGGRRYDKTFWAAFAKPVRTGCRRCLKPLRPYDFRDEPEELAVIPAEWIEVEVSLIPPSDMPRSEREAKVHASIEAWCARHGLEADKFVDLQPAPVAATPRNIGRNGLPVAAERPAQESLPGVAALRQLVEAVPAVDRSKFSLPFDLIHALLSRA